MYKCKNHELLYNTEATWFRINGILESSTQTPILQCVVHDDTRIVDSMSWEYSSEMDSMSWEYSSEMERPWFPRATEEVLRMLARNGVESSGPRDRVIHDMICATSSGCPNFHLTWLGLLNPSKNKGILGGNCYRANIGLYIHLRGDLTETVIPGVPPKTLRSTIVMLLISNMRLRGNG
jgi:hypothetical protein